MAEEQSYKHVRVRAETYELLEEFRADPRFFPQLAFGKRPSLDRAIEAAVLRAKESRDPKLREAREVRDRSVREYIEAQDRLYRESGGR